MPGRVAPQSRARLAAGQRLAVPHAFCRALLGGYNVDYHHSGIGLTIPIQIDFTEAEAIYEACQVTRNQDFTAAPKHVIKSPPKPHKRLQPYGSTNLISVRAQISKPAAFALTIMERFRCLNV